MSPNEELHTHHASRFSMNREREMQIENKKNESLATDKGTNKSYHRMHCSMDPISDLRKYRTERKALIIH